MMGQHYHFWEAVMALSTSKTLLKISLVALGIFTYSSYSHAGIKNVRDATITMKSGNKAGLQYLYAWDKNCRPVNVRFKALKAAKGRLYTVPGRFKVSRSQSKKCAGRTIRGKKVVFRANRNSTGRTVVKYRIASNNIANDYVISRPIKLKKK